MNRRAVPSTKELPFTLLLFSYLAVCSSIHSSSFLLETMSLFPIRIVGNPSECSKVYALALEMPR